MSTISERLGVSNDIIEFKFGKSFTSKREGNKSKSSNDSSEGYHTIRYDFKPVSVDTTKPATIEFNEKNKVTVTAPNVDGSGMFCTVFQGSKKPHLKECVLVIDHDTGEITLEKLTNNIVVKKTRAEGGSRLKNLQQQTRPITPSSSGTSKAISPRRSNGTNQGSPITKSSNKSPPISSTSSLHRSPISQPSTAPLLNSMPTFSSLTSNQNGNSAASSSQSTSLTSTIAKPNKVYEDEMLGVLSSSSSSSGSSSSEDEDDDDSSSSSSSSSSDDEDEVRSTPAQSKPITSSVPTFGLIRPAASMPSMPKSTMSDSSSSSDEMEESEDENLSSLNNNLMNSLNNGLSNVGLSNGSSLPAPSIGFSMPSMPKFSQLNKDLQLSESGSDSD